MVGKLWELRLQYAGTRMYESQAREMQQFIDQGGLEMPIFDVIVSLPRNTEAIQTLKVYAMDETDARSRTKRLLHEVGWILPNETEIISVKEIVPQVTKSSH